MYRKQTHIHFIGIGGIGMSGIAKILTQIGYKISGCDIEHNKKSIRELINLGCNIFSGNNTPQCKDPSIDIVVYSSAIKDDYPEIIAAQERGIPTIARALMLAELMRTKFSIVIGGSHGKTTTTSMISHILIEAKKDPTVIVGGHLKNISTNARIGSGDFLVAEADESDKSIERLHPTLAVLTNIDREHLDVYSDVDAIKSTFSKFINNVPFYGKAFVCADDLQIREIIHKLPHIKMIKFAIEADADYNASDINLKPSSSSFVLRKKDTKQKETISIPMPGRHNILNALAAIAVTQDLGIHIKTIQAAFNTFQGVERRFSFRGVYRAAEIFDDYGHHPTEIFHTLQVARARTQNRLIVLFQPHRYSRTHQLWSDFINTFLHSEINHLIVTDIYAASEAPLPEITSKRFVETLNQHNPRFSATYIPYQSSFEELCRILENFLEPGDLLLLQGAGNINKIAQKLILSANS